MRLSPERTCVALIAYQAHAAPLRSPSCKSGAFRHRTVLDLLWMPAAMETHEDSKTNLFQLPPTQPAQPNVVLNLLGRQLACAAIASLK
jgi:hypothetical protein